ncbi:MAG: hypothetical protein II877_03310 [Synergistaceae bacterium]|nr:hypothetical protein [Synergistaceae bacterium]MBR0258522.1 hypothetical protein [Synergistaceae bacterium]
MEYNSIIPDSNGLIRGLICRKHDRAKKSADKFNVKDSEDFPYVKCLITRRMTMSISPSTQQKDSRNSAGNIARIHAQSIISWHGQRFMALKTLGRMALFSRNLTEGR